MELLSVIMDGSAIAHHLEPSYFDALQGLMDMADALPTEDRTSD